VRTAWLYSAHGANFIKTIMRLAGEQRELRVVNDQYGCPTHAEDLAHALALVMPLPLKGIVHAAGSGHCTWHELASAIVSFMAVPVNVLPISTKDAGRPAPRPAYGVLANRILAGAGISLPHWKDSLAKFLKLESGTLN
jgi:dTDP-4-dehydrorhamnose reductase